MKLYCLDSFDTNQLTLRLQQANRSRTFIRNNLWKYEFFLTKLVNRLWTRSHGVSGWQHINSDYLFRKLSKMMVDGKQQKAHLIIKEDLRQWGVILHHTEYYTENGQVRKKPLYKINDELLNSATWHESNTECPVEDDEYIQEFDGIYAQIHSALSRIEIDRQAAVDYCIRVFTEKINIRSVKKNFVWHTNRKMDAAVYHSWLASVDAINDGRVNMTVDRHRGRVFHHAANCPTPLREYMTIDAKRLVELDISNCQPMLLVALLRDYTDSFVSPVELEDYKQLCEEGRFYSYVADLLKEAGEEVTGHYQAFKIDFFSKIFFSTENKKYKWRKLFDQRFPTISHAISCIKHGDHAKLANNLQAKEAEIMIVKALSKIYASGINNAFPIHDAIYVEEQYAEQCKKHIEDVFALYNIKPSIKMKMKSPENLD